MSRYRIPGTPRILTMCIDADVPIDPASYTEVLRVIRARMTLHISTHGDGLLWPRDTTIRFNLPHCFLKVVGKGLTPTAPLLMTYGMVREVVDGLQDHVEQAGFREVFWDLEDQGGRFLGHGNVVEVESPSTGGV